MFPARLIELPRFVMRVRRLVTRWQFSTICRTTRTRLARRFSCGPRAIAFDAQGSVRAPYWRLRASFSISVTVTLYFAITSLTKAVTWATSGFSGISAFSISIMPFSIAT